MHNERITNETTKKKNVEQDVETSMIWLPFISSFINSLFHFFVNKINTLYIICEQFSIVEPRSVLQWFVILVICIKMCNVSKLLWIQHVL